MLASTNTIIDVDVFGSTVNYCAKINKLADPYNKVLNIGSAKRTFAIEIDAQVDKICL